MTGEDLYNAMSDIEPGFIVDAAPMASRCQRLRLQRWLCAAACLCLLFHLLTIGATVYENTLPSRYTAENAASLFAARDSNAVGTKAYTKVSVPDASYLQLNTDVVPKYLNVYEYASSRMEFAEEEFREFFEDKLLAAAQMLNIPVPEYKVEMYDSLGEYYKSLDLDIEPESCYISARQYEDFHSFSISAWDGNPLYLNGERLQVDQRLTDEQIIRSLSRVKRLLYQKFGMSFTDAKVIRNFDAYSEYGAKSIEVYFYNEADHPLNRYTERPVSDYLLIAFHNGESWKSFSENGTILIDSDIQLNQRRKSVSQAYKIDRKVRSLSLQEAEELLLQGYVFGNHICELCMQSQQEITFDGYDHVSFTYLFYDGFGGMILPDESLGIPFYVFFKEIGTGENGNTVYARTYVPAIELEGMKAYFKEQQKEHR